MTTNQFTRFNLRPHLEQALAENGCLTPTPIQSAVIPAMLAGCDVIGQSQTGSGKTIAFSLPVLHQLEEGHPHVQCLVLTPTRELAIQVADAINQYGRQSGVRVLAAYGGQPYIRQINCLKKGVDIVVATPGRLLDLIEKKVLDLGKIATVVIDEADEMFSMGFIADIENILDKTNADRQTALFSATLPPAIRRLAERYMTAPKSFTIGSKQLTVATVDQRYYLVHEKDKLAALTRIFEIEQIASALVFVRTRMGTGVLANELVGRGFAAETLSGELSQEAREGVLNRFRNNQSKVLVATDVAARGLDIDHISHVFNYDLPHDPEAYVHRIGRTARAGKSGIAISLLSPGEQCHLRRIERYTRQTLNQAKIPTEADIQMHRDAHVVNKMMVWLERGRCMQDRKIVEDLAAKGYDLIEIAAAALKLSRAGEKQRPIASIGEVKEDRPKKLKQIGNRPAARKNGWERTDGPYEKGMARLTLSSGKADGLCINHIVGSLAHYADIPGHCIGKVLIEKQTTFVDVPEKLVGQILAKTGGYRIGRQRITVERA
jgi:ATP-dependent RNA helicase DeaD